MTTKRKRKPTQDTSRVSVAEYKAFLTEMLTPEPPVFPPSWGLVNGKLVNRSLPDNNSVNMPESMKLPPELRGKNAVHHYTPVQRMGYPPGVKCWCGAVLDFAYHEPGQHKRRQAFFAEHDECEPKASDA